MSDRTGGRRENAHSSEVEWLDVGPPPRAPGERWKPPRWRWWYALVALAVLAGIIVSTQQRTRPHSANHPTPSSHPSPSSRSGSSTSDSPQAPSSTFPVATVEVTSAGRPLLDVPPTWELLGLTPSSVVRIQLAQGRTTMTPVPLQPDGASTSLLVGSDRVLVLSSNSAAGYQVRDGRPKSALPTVFTQVDEGYPGPDADHVWIPADGSGQHWRLVGIDGSSTSTSLSVPVTPDSVNSDGDGYLLFYGVGGVYDLRPSGISRITTGTLVAAGPTRWLVTECNGQYACATSVIDRSTGARRQLAHAIFQSDFLGQGPISPDGQTAVVLRTGTGADSQQDVVALVDLRTGAVRNTGLALPPDQAYVGNSFVWSPDSRWVFVTADTGPLYAISAPDGTVSRLNVMPGPVITLGLRVDASS